MWATLQQESFLVGAALVLIYQAAKFGQLKSDDPIASRYMTLLPGAQVRDFAGPYAYHVAFTAFLGVSFVVYFLVCQISPDILKGVVKLLVGNEQALQAIDGIPYPLYVAALFMGLTQPVIPLLSRLGEAQRNFFHERIEVPRRIIDLSENLTTAIETRSGADKKQAANEVRRLVGGKFLLDLQGYGDVAFYKLQLEKLELNNGTLEQTLKQSSLKDLNSLIERLVLYALVAVMRRSGPKALTKLARYLDAPDVAPAPAGFGYLFASFIGSSVVFCLGLLIIGHALAASNGVVAGLFHRTAYNNLWPMDLANVGQEFWAIVPPIFVCLIVAISLLVPQDQAPNRHAAPEAGASLMTEFVNFFRSSASVLGLCIVISLLIKFGQLFVEYGGDLPVEARTPIRLLLPVVQSFIPVSVCLFTTWYLVSSRDSSRRGLSFSTTVLAVAVSTGLIGLLYDLTFMPEYLRVRPEDAPGDEHILFSVVANALVSVCAFASVALFFKARTTLAQATQAHHEPSSAAPAAPETPVQ